MADNPTPNGPEKITYQGRMIEIVEQPMKIGEKEVTFEHARRAPGVRLIVPMPDGKILLTREYRTHLNGYDFRLPGGKVIDSLDEYNAFLASKADIKEAAHTAAIKEAREEAGLDVTDLELFSVSKCGGSMEWDLYYFVVKSFTQGEQSLEHGEDITPAPTSREEVKKMCLDGRIQEDRSALMLLRYLAQ
jgi:ADP-ribose pyrophosphatase